MPEMKLEQGRDCMEDYMLQKGLPLRKPFRCLNPSHEDRNPSMSYNSHTRKVHCFSCGVTYDIFDLVGLDYRLNGIRDQYEKVRDLFGLEAHSPKYLEVDFRSRDASFPAPEDKCAFLRNMESKASGELEYFLSRGISRESCKKHGLFQWMGRAVFPVWEDGKCTGWSARSIDSENGPRYKNSQGALGVWNGDLIRSNGGGEPLYVTEGIVDAVLLEQSGRHAVALCGSQNTEKLYRRCESAPETAGTWHYILCGDPDEAGRKMNAALMDKLTKLGLSSSVMPLEPEDGDIGELFLRDPERLESLLERTCKEETGSSHAIPAGNYASRFSAASDIEEFFHEAEKRAARGLIRTGFSGLDKLLDGGLHPGLYVLGAISSLGKTSFVLQVADYISAHASDVLFFSLEQSRRELMAKSLSRISYELARDNKRAAVTVRGLLSGNFRNGAANENLLEESRKLYAKSAGRLYISEGLADIGADEIRDAVKEHREATGNLPVVVVDYLQILRPSEARATDKQNTDRSVVELKRISRDFDIPVLAISSFNRENYRSAVSMEAFKESGAVEYSSDVLLGLQLAGAGSRDFDVNAAKSREPRQVELVMLKNRNGIPYAKVRYSYYAGFGFFAEEPRHIRDGKSR